MADACCLNVASLLPFHLLYATITSICLDAFIRSAAAPLSLPTHLQHTSSPSCPAICLPRVGHKLLPIPTDVLAKLICPFAGAHSQPALAYYYWGACCSSLPPLSYVQWLCTPLPCPKLLCFDSPNPRSPALNLLPRTFMSLQSAFCLPCNLPFVLMRQVTCTKSPYLVCP